MIVFFVAPNGTIWPVKRIVGGKGESAPVVQTSQTNTAPWATQQPFLTQGFEEAEKQFKGPKPQFYPNATVVPYSPATETSLAIKEAQALSPDSLVSMAGRETGKTLAGEHLGPGSQAYQGMMRGISDIVIPQTATQFGQAGRGTRSPGYAEALGRGITTGMTPYLAAERGRMFDATQTAMPVSQFSPNLLAQTGAARELQARDILQEDMDRWNFDQNVESNKLARYMQNVVGGTGSTSSGTSTQPSFSNPLMTGLGAAASTAGIGQSLFGPKGGGGIFGK